MTAVLVKILVGALALGLGVLLGLPGRGGRSAASPSRWKIHRPGPDSAGVHDEDELEALERDLGRTHALRRRAKRYFTPLDLLRSDRRGSHRRRTRRYFHTAAPRERGGGGGPRRPGGKG